MILSIYIVIVVCAFLLSLSSFWLHDAIHLKLFSVILGLTVLTELVANFFLECTGLTTRNALYNIFMLLEFSGFIGFYYLLIKRKIIKKILLALLVLLPVFWLYTSFTGEHNLDYWNNDFVIASFLITILCAALYCFQLFVSEELVNFSRHTEFWISIGLILFYMCNFPYLGMYQLVIQYFDGLAEELKLVLQISGCVMYLMFCFAYYIRICSIRKSLP